jgi:hypothetical protein
MHTLRTIPGTTAGKQMLRGIARNAFVCGSLECSNYQAVQNGDRFELDI